MSKGHRKLEFNVDSRKTSDLPYNLSRGSRHYIERLHIRLKESPIKGLPNVQASNIFDPGVKNLRA